MAQILIIDDDDFFCGSLARSVRKLGHQTAEASTLRQGQEMAVTGDFEVVFLDVMLPDGNGLEAIPAIKGCNSSPEVIIVTGVGSPDGAELAIKNGALDYLQKGSSHHELALALKRILEYRKSRVQAPAPKALDLSGIIGNSPQMQKCYDSLAQAAGSNASVLIFGETGTGKELFAWAIHQNSMRADQNFVVVDCAALPESLVESVLFGHKKGAFTGADKDRGGLIEQADGGTLFLDEVGELPMKVQASFLRVLQEHIFRPVGSAKEISSNFRLISATNRDLDSMVTANQFRADLLFRLRATTIELPLLRDRDKDIKQLTTFHLARICEKNAQETKGLSPSFIEALNSYTWPGNVRELVSAIEYAVGNAGSAPTLYPEHLPTNIRISLAQVLLAGKTPTQTEPLPKPAEYIFSTTERPSHKEVMDRETNKIEEQYFSQLMVFVNWDVQEACQISGLKRSALYGRLKKYGIKRQN